MFNRKREIDIYNQIPGDQVRGMKKYRAEISADMIGDVLSGLSRLDRDRASYV